MSCQILGEPFQQFFSITGAFFSGLFKFDDTVPNLPVGRGHQGVDGTGAGTAGRIEQFADAADKANVSLIIGAYDRITANYRLGTLGVRVQLVVLSRVSFPSLTSRPLRVASHCPITIPRATRVGMFCCTTLQGLFHPALLLSACYCAECANYFAARLPAARATLAAGWRETNKST